MTMGRIRVGDSRVATTCLRKLPSGVSYARHHLGDLKGNDSTNPVELAEVIERDYDSVSAHLNIIACKARLM